MNLSLKWFLIVAFFTCFAGAQAGRAQSAEDFPPPPDGMMPPMDFKDGGKGGKMLEPPPFLKDDDLLKRAFGNRDPEIMKFVRNQIESKGPDGLQDPAFRAELKRKLNEKTGISQAPPPAADAVLKIKKKEDKPSPPIPNPISSSPAQKPGSVISPAQAEDLIAGFEVMIDDKAGTVEIKVKIPSKCKSDLKLEPVKSADSDEFVRFRIIDSTGHGLACLKSSNNKPCGNSNECVSLADSPVLYKKPPREINDCAHCGPQRPPGLPEDGLRTSGFDDMDKIAGPRRDKKPPGLDPDKFAEQKIKRINSMPCPEPGEDMEEMAGTEPPTCMKKKAPGRPGGEGMAGGLPPMGAGGGFGGMSMMGMGGGFGGMGGMPMMGMGSMSPMGGMSMMGMGMGSMGGYGGYSRMSSPQPFSMMGGGYGGYGGYNGYSLMSRPQSPPPMMLGMGGYGGYGGGYGGFGGGFGFGFGGGMFGR